jgi:histidine triad (HIT) family protein
MENKCIFCSIVKGELPASIVYEDDDLLAIMDIQPINPGHVLVMPKSCYQRLHQVPENLTQKLFTVVARIEKALWETEGIVCEGTNILQNNGRSAWQEVNHVHFHIIPRFSGDGFKIKYQSKHPERQELEKISKKIMSSLTPNT